MSTLSNAGLSVAYGPGGQSQIGGARRTPIIGKHIQKTISNAGMQVQYNQNGEGFFKDVGKAIVKGAKKTNEFLKDTKIISKTAGVAAGIGALTGVVDPKKAAAIAGIAKATGYGKKGKKN